MYINVQLCNKPGTGIEVFREQDVPIWEEANLSEANKSVNNDHELSSILLKRTQITKTIYDLY